MSQGAAIELIGSGMAMILAVRAFRSQRPGFDRTAALAVIWLAIIGGLALVLQRLGE